MELSIIAIDAVAAPTRTLALLLRAGLNSLRKIQISSKSKKNTNGLTILSGEEERARKRW